MKLRCNEKRYLKRRILRNIAMVLVFSTVLSTVVSYIFFEGIIRRQAIKDEEVKLQQLARQIEFMEEDISNFARSIVVDDLIQGILEEKEFETEYQRLKSRDVINKQLVFYNSLRTYIACSFIEYSSGERFSSNGNLGMEKEYLDEKFNTGEIKEYREQSKWRFSNPYYSRDSGSEQYVICTSTLMLNQYNFGAHQGTLYLEIYLDYFIRQIQSCEKDYANLALIGNDGKILYEYHAQEGMQAYIEQMELKRGKVYTVNEGYLLSEEIEGTGWKICTLITREELWRRSGFVLGFFLLSFVISLALMLTATSRLLETIVRPIVKLSEHMEKMNYKELHTELSVHTKDEIQTLYECYDKMLAEIGRGIESKMLYEKQKKDMQFDIMLSQINPHYLYNVLNTVVYLATAENSDAVIQIVNSLIYNLQETLRLGEGTIYNTIDQEIEFTQAYVRIQEYRYPKGFQVNIGCDPEVKCCVVPKMIMQPIVENAIFHGILPSGKCGRIHVCIQREENTLIIEITDDGVGISKESLQLFEEREEIIYEAKGRRHIGISNIRERIAYLYGETYGMWIENKTQQGTRVIIKVPVRYHGEDIE